MYHAGEILSRPMDGLWTGLITHKGVATGMGTVVHACKRAGITIEEPVNSFSKGFSVKSEGVSPCRNGVAIALLAKQRLGRPYNLFTDNCEHLVNEVSGYGKHSPQLAIAVVIGLITALGLVLSKK